MSDPSELRFFDLGLAKGRQIEQEQIIKLLEENAQGEYKQIMLTPKLIRLIKGETNE